MFCRNCGKKLSDNAAFCAYCGTKVEISHPSSEAIPAKSEPGAVIDQNNNTVEIQSQNPLTENIAPAKETSEIEKNEESKAGENKADESKTQDIKVNETITAEAKIAETNQ